MSQARERKKRQMSAEKKRRATASIASCQKEFDGPHTCTKCAKVFHSREWVSPNTKPICVLCHRLLAAGVEPLEAPVGHPPLGFVSETRLMAYIRQCYEASGKLAEFEATYK